MADSDRISWRRALVELVVIVTGRRHRPGGVHGSAVDGTAVKVRANGGRSHGRLGPGLMAVLLVVAPIRIGAQTRSVPAPSPRTALPPPLPRTPDSWWDSRAPSTVLQPPQEEPSPSRIILTHALVGTGTGLLIGLALTGASLGDDDTSVVITWSALGLGAGLVSGAVTWLLHRRKGASASIKLPSDASTSVESGVSGVAHRAAVDVMDRRQAP